MEPNSTKCSTPEMMSQIANNNKPMFLFHFQCHGSIPNKRTEFSECRPCGTQAALNVAPKTDRTASRDRGQAIRT